MIDEKERKTAEKILVSRSLVQSDRSFPHAGEPRKLGTGAIALRSYSHFRYLPKLDYRYDDTSLQQKPYKWLFLAQDPAYMALSNCDVAKLEPSWA